MATQYTPILQLALPVTGELNGTWGNVVNDNITSMVEEAIAGLATISTWTANSHTLTVANGTTDEARCAMLVLQTGSGGTALSGAGQVICPYLTKLYVVKNDSAYAVTVKTSGGTGIAVAAGDAAFVFCDGTNVNACVTQIINGHITGNLTVDGNTTLGNSTSDTITANARIASDLNPSADNTYDLGTAGNSWRNLYIDGTATIATLNVTTIDTTNLEVTNIKAKDGTAAITLADSTGVATLAAAPILNAGGANQVQYLNGSKSLSGSSNMTFDGTTMTLNTLNLTNALATGYGGTGLASYTAGDITYYASGTSLTKLPIGTNGYVLKSTGTAPAWEQVSNIAVTTFSGGTTGLTPASPTGGAVTLAGTLALTNGGTGATTVSGAQTNLQVDPAGTAVAMAIALG